MDLRPGDVVYGSTTDDEYEITRLIDSGGFGIVYEVRSRDGDLLALKTIITAYLDDDDLRALLNEGELATQVEHENVVRVFSFHDGQQFPDLPAYMLMEYADGGTLNDLLRDRRSDGQHFAPPELRAVFLQLASGMRAVNEKLVHRDIKPDNILMVNNILKISDFGLSKVVGAATRSRTFKGINHFMYCAPEAWQSDSNVPSMDMYSMGITFYEIATLRHPFEGRGDSVEAWKQAHLFMLPTDPREHNSSLDPTLAQIIMRMMSKRPEDRYSGWDEVIERLSIAEAERPRLRDLSSLVARATTRHKAKEKERLAFEASREKHEEQMGLLDYCFSEIVAAAGETVKAFNEQSEFTKLIMRSQATGFSIYSDKGVGAIPTVRAAVTLANDVAIRDQQIIRAWGTVKAPSGKGFNLLLVARDNNDLYGHWHSLHVTHNPIARRRDERPEPFPFEIHELPKEIHLLNAMHIYQTTKEVFRAEMLDPLLAELLEN